MSRPEPVGRFLWYELLTSDREAAADFYCSVMGWTTDTWEAGDEPYLMLVNGDHRLGGVMAMPEEAKREGAPPHWLPYVGVADVDVAVGRAAELGGGVLMPPMEIPDVGRIAVLSDPAGAAFAVFDPEGEMEPPEDPGGVGEISWHELATDDWPTAMAFYRDLFGWGSTGEHPMGESGVYAMFGLDGVSLGGMYDAPEGPSAWLLYARAADLGEALGRVRDAGGEALCDPMEVPGGLVAPCRDPQGAAFALHQVVSEEQASGDVSSETARSGDRATEAAG